MELLKQPENIPRGVGRGPSEGPRVARTPAKAPPTPATQPPGRIGPLQLSQGIWGKYTSLAPCSGPGPPCCVTLGKPLGLSGPLFPHLPRGLDDVVWDEGLQTFFSMNQYPPSLLWSGRGRLVGACWARTRIKGRLPALHPPPTS